MKPSVARSGDQKHQIEAKYRSKPGVPGTPAEYQRPLLGVPTRRGKDHPKEDETDRQCQTPPSLDKINSMHQRSPRLFPKGINVIEIADNDTTVLDLDTMCQKGGIDERSLQHVLRVAHGEHSEGRTGTRWSQRTEHSRRDSG